MQSFILYGFLDTAVETEEQQQQQKELNFFNFNFGHFFEDPHILTIGTLL